MTDKETAQLYALGMPVVFVETKDRANQASAHVRVAIKLLGWSALYFEHAGMADSAERCRKAIAIVESDAKQEAA